MRSWQLAIVLVPYSIKGGLMVPVIRNAEDTKSFYEVIDVLLRDVYGMTALKPGTANRSSGQESSAEARPMLARRRSSMTNAQSGGEVITSVPMEAVPSSDRKAYVQSIQRSMKVAYALLAFWFAALLIFGEHCTT